MRFKDVVRNEVDEIDRAAHDWVAKLASREATLADAEALRQWRQQSPAHDQAYLTATQLWREFRRASRALSANGYVPPWTEPNQILSRRAVLGGAGTLAAGAIGYTIVQPPLGLWPSFTELTADYRTATGEQREVVLSERVSVRMNTQTSLTLASSTSETRQVKLISGQAAFATASAPPLVVRAADGQAVASEARFEVRNIGPSVCVTCLHGLVRVQQGEDVAELRPNQQIDYDSMGLRQARTVDPAEVTAWQNGLLVFRLTPLSDVVAEINRYRPGKVILMKTALESKPVAGRFKIQSMDEVLVWIEQAFGLTARTLPGGIVLLS
jgi:transmembrane sensor